MSEGRADALRPGSRLHVYTLKEVLGAGGFGITYRAIEDITERPVAIKEFLPSAVAQRAPDGVSVRPLSRGAAIDFEWGLDRFRLEARTLIALRHPNIVPVLTYFEANGTGYLVMEYQNGRTLGALIKPDKRLSQFELDEILHPLLDALEAVHAKGFLHRDIKPDNIFIREDGKPLLIDFGAARQAVGAKSQSLTAIVSEGYAPFEQYESDSPQGPWTDLYALGCTLYRCMTGVRPTPAPKRIGARMANQPDPLPPLRGLAGPRYDGRLVAAVDDMMRTVGSERPQSVAALRALLGPSVRHGDGTRPAPGPRIRPRGQFAAAMRRWSRDRRVWLGAGGAALIAGAIVLGIAWYDAWRFDGLIAAAEADIARREFAQAERSLDDAARLRPGATSVRLLRTRLAEERRIEAGERATPQIVLKNRDCADCPELVEIPAGRFTMGSPPEEQGHYDQESPQHEVAIARAFLIGKYEVTVGQFRAFIAKSGYKPVLGCATFDPDGGTYRLDPYASWSNPDFPVSDNHPVVCVSWTDAKAYAAWLARETGKTYRLPTEAEWEYAARAGEGAARLWDNADAACQHANVADASTRGRLPKNWERFACDDRHAFTAPVGRFKPNAFGLHDMLGNAWEWVEDCFNRRYDGAPADGSAWLGGDCAERVMRGGAWISQVRDVRLANRGHNLSERGYYSAGFRVAREK